MRFFSSLARRPLRWAIAAPAALVLAAGAWWWTRAAEPPPGPSDAALAAADPEVAAAVRTARESVMREPHSAEAWGLLGQVLLANGFESDADVSLGRAESLEPDEPRWPYLRATGLSRDRDAAFAAAGRAVAACQRAGRTEATPYLFLAELDVERGDRASAEALCRRVLDAEPNNFRAHLDLGLIALTDNDPAECVPHLLRAAESPTTRHTAYTQLAAVYQRQGNEAASADYARRARQSPPDEAGSDPYVDPMQELTTGRTARRRQVDQLQAQGRLREAIPLLRQMTDDDPSDDHTLVLLGATLMRTGDFSGAEQTLGKAAALAPKSMDPAYYLSMALYTEGVQLRGTGDPSAAADKFRQAADAARRAVEIKPDDAQAHAFLGLALQQLGRRPEAIEAFRAALRCRPEDAEAHLVLGQALAEDGQEGEALVQLQYACDLAAPEDPRPRQALDRFRAAH